MNSKSLAYSILQKSKKLDVILSFCQNLLYQECAKDHLQYLNSRLPLEYQQKFRFGYFPPWKHLELLPLDLQKDLKDLKLLYQWNVSDQFNSKFGTCFYEHHNLIFPTFDDGGNIVCLNGRTLLSDYEQRNLHIDKYKNGFYTKSQVLFGLHHTKQTIAQTGKVFLVEGQLDALTCYRHGIDNVVALCGTALSEYQMYLLSKYGGPDLTIYLMLDNDEAGKKAALKIMHKYKNVQFEQVIIPEPFKDIDEYLNKSGDHHFLSIF